MSRLVRNRRLVLGLVALLMGLTATVQSATPGWATYGLGVLYLVPVVLTAVAFGPWAAVAVSGVAAVAAASVVGQNAGSTGAQVVLLSFLFRGLGYAGVGAVIGLYARSLHRLAYRDQLTGLPNRRAFFDEITEWSTTSRRFVVVACDVDGLKAINDRSGHAAGDAAIRRVADDFVAALGAESFVARVGGDEFLALVPAPAVAAPHVAGASTGLAPHPGSAAEIDATIARADASLYRAKHRTPAVAAAADRTAA